MSIMTPMPFLLSLGPCLLKVLMMPFVRLRLPIQTWICPISLLKSWTNQQLNPSIRRVRRIYLQMMPLRMMQPSILRVTGMLLLKANRKPLRRIPVIPLTWKSTVPQPFSSRFFILCKDFGKQLISILTVALCI